VDVLEDLLRSVFNIFMLQTNSCDWAIETLMSELKCDELHKASLNKGNINVLGNQKPKYMGAILIYNRK